MKTLMLMALMMVSGAVFADSVQSCLYQDVHSLEKNKGEQSSAVKKVSKSLVCRVTLTRGKPGDMVQIRTPRNYIIAEGKIIKHLGGGGADVVIIRRDPNRDPKVGYPVFLLVDESDAHWSATMSPF